MIKNSITKHLIIQGKQSKTDTGNSLIEICDELGLNDLKMVLEKLETVVSAKESEVAVEREKVNSES